jgi:hypothetical protein
LVVDLKKVCGSLTPETISWSIEWRGKTVRIAELRAEYLASRVVLTLEVRLPQDGTSAESDDVSSSGLRGGRRTIWVASIEACKVGVDVTVDIQVACGFSIIPILQLR